MSQRKIVLDETFSYKRPLLYKFDNYFLYPKKSPKTATELVSRREFLDSVLGSGLLIYLSPVWLSEVYDLVNELDVFEFGMRCGEGGRVNTLKSLLVDLDGLGKTHRGAQLLCDYRQGHCLNPHFF